ncbi:HAAAP family serine/threonine permease [Craterilacuibacter sinensis]|uniref:HAAAP family serine/threonine permease n=1 Tax=Craterilacuibacter sinensis TaxID=2686017 RepID=A0A845BS92_9NEIS|nr:HAAAP family serine/threonine permease [Craterilacuibacter sinensis]MXR38094.1 HAAAP family serine/threonine permease [Craterilacuibacter sinensis]
MSQSNVYTPEASVQAGQAAAGKSAWTRQDTTWMLGLYGTAVGAGTLFLPINAGIGGFWPLLVMLVLAWPLTYFAHRGLNRFVLSGSTRDGDITEVVEEHFGLTAGKLITLLYFFAIYPILLVYSVAITNTVMSFLTNQFGIQLGNDIVTRGIFALGLILALMSVVRLGGEFIVKAMSVLVFPFVAALMLLALYLVPHWNSSMIDQAGTFSAAVSSGAFWKTLWLAIPVMVFSFNHSPIISSFAVDQKKLHPGCEDAASNRTLSRAHIMMVASVFFFVFSCVLSLSPADLAEAKAQNLSILSYLANHFQNPIIAWVAPLIAIVAISKSFFGHYLGAKEGFNGLVIKELRQRGKTIDTAKLDRFTAVFMIVTTWIVATLNPNILGMIENLGGPVIAVLLFLMPMYAIYKVPAMKKYAGVASNIFVVAIGLIAISAIFYSLVF